VAPFVWVARLRGRHVEFPYNLSRTAHLLSLLFVSILLPSQSSSTPSGKEFETLSERGRFRTVLFLSWTTILPFPSLIATGPLRPVSSKQNFYTSINPIQSGFFPSRFWMCFLRSPLFFHSSPLVPSFFRRLPIAAVYHRGYSSLRPCKGVFLGTIPQLLLLPPPAVSLGECSFLKGTHYPTSRPTPPCFAPLEVSLWLPFSVLYIMRAAVQGRAS